MNIPKPITDPQSQTSYSDLAHISEVDYQALTDKDSNQRILGRQIPSGNIRGNQTITGSLIINNPATNTTAITIDGASQTTLYTDPTTGINQIILGKLPDGTFGLVIAKPGIDVLSVFG